MKIREMTAGDHPAVIELLQNSGGVRPRDADSLANIERYLERNPGFSFVAVESGQIIGCIMSGHDGRRGYLQHLAVLSVFPSRFSCIASDGENV